MSNHGAVFRAGNGSLDSYVRLWRLCGMSNKSISIFAFVALLLSALGGANTVYGFNENFSPPIWSWIMLAASIPVIWGANELRLWVYKVNSNTGDLAALSARVTGLEDKLENPEASVSAGQTVQGGRGNSDHDPATHDRKELMSLLRGYPEDCQALLRKMRMESRRQIILQDGDNRAETLSQNDVFLMADFDGHGRLCTWEITDQFWRVLKKEGDWKEVFRDLA